MNGIAPPHPTASPTEVKRSQGPPPASRAIFFVFGPVTAMMMRFIVRGFPPKAEWHGQLFYHCKPNQLTLIAPMMQLDRPHNPSSCIFSIFHNTGQASSQPPRVRFSSLVTAQNQIRRHHVVDVHGTSAVAWVHMRICTNSYWRPVSETTVLHATRCQHRHCLSIDDWAANQARPTTVFSLTPR